MGGWQYYWNPWFRERHVYVVALSPAACRERLEGGGVSWPGGRSRRPLVGGGTVRLSCPIGYRNPSKPYASVRLRAVQGGTHVRVTIGGRLSSRMLAAVWLGVAVTLTVLTATGGTASPSLPAHAIQLFGVAFEGAFLLIHALGRLLAHRHPDSLLGYIRERLLIPDPTLERGSG
jgi:hypothetical protein